MPVFKITFLRHSNAVDSTIKIDLLESADNLQAAVSRAKGNIADLISLSQSEYRIIGAHEMPEPYFCAHFPNGTEAEPNVRYLVTGKDYDYVVYSDDTIEGVRSMLPAAAFDVWVACAREHFAR